MAALLQRVLVVSSVSSIRAFVPFADVEDLRPQRLENFCSAADARRGGLRWCRHAVRKQLEDGGDVQLEWRMHIDPDRILSMDTEAAHGARLVSCFPGQLELVLPASHEHHAAKDHIIVASRFAHNCQHLTNHGLYHRVVEVQRHERHHKEGRGYEAHVRLSTEEMPSFAHVARAVDFHFSYMPPEARDVQPFPPMRTDFGMDSRSSNDRRLKEFSFDALRRGLGSFKHSALEGMESNAGGFHAGQRTSGGIRTQNGILNLSPKQVSNFGWNWNFAMNATEEPEFNITGPGARGIFKVHEPYIKVHAGIYLNFSSAWTTGFTSAPRVRWEAGLHGHGYVQARIMSLLNTTEEAELDPFKTLQAYNIDIPMLGELAKPKWFEKIDFAAGSLPISMEPGFQFQAKIYHAGTFKGALAVGGKTHGIVHPSLSYDSERGFDAHFDGTLVDSDVWPPLWMIFTHRFELGIMFMPTVLMRGDFAGLKNETLSMELRPYLNVTVTRQDDANTIVASNGMKTLTLYPFRVTGLVNTDFHRKYKVLVTANGQLLETSEEINWGQVSFHDHLSKFKVGRMSENAVMDQLTTVTLVEVDHSNDAVTERTLGSGSVRCTSLLKGECQPKPSMAHILSSTGAEVASVELAIFHDDDPESRFASKIRGLALSVPEVMVRDLPPQPCEPLALHLQQGGNSYATRLLPAENHQNDGFMAFRGETTIEFAPTLLDAWRACPPGEASKCETPWLALYCGTSNLASGTIPTTEWTSTAAMDVPVEVHLSKPGTTESFATAKLNANIVSLPSSSSFVRPTSAEQVGLGSSMPLIWMVSNVRMDQEYAFTLSAMKLVAETSLASAQDIASAWHVNDKALIRIGGSVQTFQARCRSSAAGNPPGGDTSCTFEYDFIISGSQYGAGDQVALLVQWSDGGTDHAALSPPFEVVSSVSDSRQSVVEGRRLWSAASWNTRVAEHKESCDEKDLHFSLGAGMLMRGRLQSHGAIPQLSTGFKSIAAIAPGTDAQELLPELLCQDGLCKGALPGCRGGADYAKKHYPTLVFSYNRPFRFTEDNEDEFTAILRQALAYGFSALPEIVDVVIREVNETIQENQQSKTASTRGAMFGGRSAAQVAAAAKENLQKMLQPSAPAAGQQRTESPLLAQTLAATTTTPAAPPGAFSRWWGASRRLHGLGAVPRDNDDEAPGTHSEVTLTFREGLPYKVDRPLVEKMLRHGYFMDIHDEVSDQRPLHITDFYLDEGPVSVSTSRGAEGQDASIVLGRQSALAFSAVALLTGVVVALVLAKRQAQTTYYDAGRASDSEGVE